MNVARRPLPRPARPHGSVVVPFALILPVVLGMMGLAIDLSMLYLRNTEMQQLADSTATAAARRLDGTLAGVTAAIADAAAMAQQNTYGGEYSGAKNPFAAGTAWSQDALFFSTAPTGAPWIPAAGVTDAATAAGLLYVRVDTAELAKLSGNPGTVSTTLMRFVGAPDSVTAAPVSVAGQTGMPVTPLAVCALKTTKFTQHSPTILDRVEFGFRRGVPYDLLNLSFSGSTPQRFVVNPIDGAGVTNPDPAHYSNKFIKPFFCSGGIGYGGLRTGASVYVRALDAVGADIHDWLNSRFGDYTGDGDACTSRSGAPPDTNVKEFIPANVKWMPTARPAARSYADTQLYTVADPGTLPGQVDVKDYGPLWVNAKPVNFVTGSKFTISDIPTLYPTNAGTGWSQAAKTTLILYYRDPPYKNDAPVAPPSGIAVPLRRLLNVPLLDCSGAVGSKATVLGIGQFLMTARATSASVYAEFDGLADESTLAANVRRIQ